VTRLAYKLGLVMALCALALPALANASPGAVIRDCAEDGRLDRKYSNSDLRKAEDKLPADLDEYSDCREVIAGAITSGSDRGGGRESGGGAGGKNSSPAAAARAKAARAEDAAALESLAASGKKPKVTVAGTKVEPEENGLFNLASATNELPLPLLLALIVATLLAILGALVALRGRYPALERIPLLSKISLPRVSLPSFRR
jgi:hypothetical protein